MLSNPGDAYQDTASPLAVRAKNYLAGDTSGWHRHGRTQFLYATQGLMTAITEHGRWVVPQGYALLIPPQLEHNVEMHGAVAIRNAYLLPGSLGTPISVCRVLTVTRLLDAALNALADEAVPYDVLGRSGHLAAIVMDEIAHAVETDFVLPMPSDVRLRRMCQSLVEKPATDLDTDDWADQLGLSRRTLTRRFRRETGLSFGQWRRRLRFVAVLTRQAQGGALREIASEVGYDDPRALKDMMKRTVSN
jgi:AraC-like DNA-binding protein